MRVQRWVPAAVAAVALSVGVIALAGTAHARVYPTNICVSKKLSAAAVQCGRVLAAWSAWERHQDDLKRDAKLVAAEAALEKKWGKAEEGSQKKGVDCLETTASWGEIETQIDAAVAGIVTSINSSLDLGNRDDGKCGSKRLKAAAVRCKLMLKAEARHIKRLAKDPLGVDRNTDRVKAQVKFDFLWNTSGNCPSAVTKTEIAETVDDLSEDLIRSATVSPNVLQDSIRAITHPVPGQPGHEVEYERDVLGPRCQDSSAYTFFAKRGTENKLLMYYEGGGACWDTETCCVPLCSQDVDPDPDHLLLNLDPNNPGGGFGDVTHPDNPFKDWNVVYVPYCTCDVHWGDASRTYEAGSVGDLLDCEEKQVEHRGHDNAKLAEKWAREHFVNPTDIFVTGSSAGSYGALMHGISLNEVYPASSINVMGDGGNGVITQEFVQSQFPNWGVEVNLPDVPGIGDVPVEDQSIPTIVTAAAHAYPRTNWAHYTTAFDGSTGGQTGFYHVMRSLEDPNSDLLDWLSWWESSCEFNEAMSQQAVDTVVAVGVTDNYRYYIGTGSRHTAFGYDKVYTDTTGGVPTLVDWINAMIADDPEGWVNVEADPFNVLLPGDPQPLSLEPPFEWDGSNTIINCSP